MSQNNVNFGIKKSFQKITKMGVSLGLIAKNVMDGKKKIITI